MYVADRLSEHQEFIKITDLSSTMQDMKFSNLGVVLSTGNSVYFANSQQFKAVLNKYLTLAKKDSSKKRNRTDTAEEGLPYINPSFSTVLPIKLSPRHHVFDVNVTALQNDLKPKKLIDLKKDEIISEIDFFDDCLVLYILQVSKSKLLFADMASFKKENNSSEDTPFEFKEINLGKGETHGLIKPGVNHNSIQQNIRFFIDTPFSYSKALDLNVSSQKTSLLDEARITGKKFAADDYQISLIYAPSIDGVRIPISLIHKKGYLNKEGLPKRVLDQKKLLLKTYGCYGMNLTLDFDISNWSLLERDWVIAYAHIRGGSELGKEWHSAALKHHKHRSVQDIISCSDFLVAHQFTHPSLFCASSNSAGAGLLASSINLKPAMFKAVHLNAPFLDIKGCLTKPELPLSASDYHEFGNPVSDPRAYDSISSICPYTNLKASDYPAILITAFKEDYRTPLWNVFKYTAKLRELNQNNQESRISPFCEGNVAVIVDDGSHNGTEDSVANLERQALTTSFFEWVVEERSKDVEIIKKKKGFFTKWL